MLCVPPAPAPALRPPTQPLLHMTFESPLHPSKTKPGHVSMSSRLLRAHDAASREGCAVVLRASFAGIGKSCCFCCRRLWSEDRSELVLRVSAAGLLHGEAQRSHL